MATAPTVTGIHHLNLSVSDLERSARWYQEVLGLEFGFELPNVEGRGHKIALLLPGTPFRLVLVQHQANDREPASEFRTGLDHVAFTVADRSALEGWQERFHVMGVTHSEIKEGATGYFIVFRDPDNIQLEVYTSSK